WADNKRALLSMKAATIRSSACLRPAATTCSPCTASGSVPYSSTPTWQPGSGAPLAQRKLILSWPHHTRTTTMSELNTLLEFARAGQQSEGKLLLVLDENAADLPPPPQANALALCNRIDIHNIASQAAWQSLYSDFDF